MKRSFSFVLLAIALTCITSGDVFAKCVTEETEPVYQLSRRLVGTDGRPIVGAKVRLLQENPDGALAVQSDEAGWYVLDGLKPGTYHVLISALGYIDHHYTLIVKDRPPRRMRSEVRLRPISECHDMKVID